MHMSDTKEARQHLVDSTIEQIRHAMLDDDIQTEDEQSDYLSKLVWWLHFGKLTAVSTPLELYERPYVHWPKYNILLTTLRVFTDSQMIAPHDEGTELRLRRLQHIVDTQVAN